MAHTIKNQVKAVTQELLAKAKPGNTPHSRPKLRQGLKQPEPIIEALFESFQTFKDPILIDALKLAKQFCLDLASENVPAYWLTMIGTPGTGKTDLARRINRFFIHFLDLLIDERQSSETRRILRHGGLRRWPKAINEIRDGDYSGIGQLSEDWFVVIDDIGSEHKGRDSDFSVAKLFEILNARLGRFTVLTANVTLEALAAMDTRIASRINRDGSKLVVMETQDFASR